MLICPRCGFRNENGEAFCGECGEYLEWEEPAAASAPAPAAGGATGAPEPGAGASVPAPGPVPATRVEPPAEKAEAPRKGASRKEAQRKEASSKEAQRAEAARKEESVRPSTAPASAGGQPAPRATAPAQPAAVTPSASTAPPVTPEAVTARRPSAVQPSAPVAPRPVRQAPVDEPPPAPGDLICGSCGAGNAPTRKFCRRCGAGLADAPVQPRRSWWYRLFHREARTGPAAGYRPHYRRRISIRSIVLILILGLVAGAVWVWRQEARSAAEGAFDAVVDRVQGNTEFNPSAMVASSESPEHPAAAAHDGTTNLYWAPAAFGDGVGEYLEAQFEAPFRLTRVIIMPGASADKQEFLAQSSPERITVTTTASDGTQQTFPITLADAAGLQDFSVPAEDVVAVRFTIDATYRATPETHVALAEVEFRGR